MWAIIRPATVAAMARRLGWTETYDEGLAFGTCDGCGGTAELALQSDGGVALSCAEGCDWSPVATWLTRTCDPEVALEA